jgi:hypothetical protein
MSRFTIVLLAASALLPVAPAEARVRIAWPSQTAVPAGKTVAVGVRSARTVRVALLRLSSDGVPVRTVKARRMRSGRFVVAVPAGRHLLAVDVGPRRRSRAIEGVVAPIAPAPPPGVADPCATDGRAAATLELDRRSAARGEALVMTVRNAGEVCLSHGHDWAFEVFRDGQWVPAHEPKAWPGGPGYTIAPGGSDTWRGVVFEELEPGRHRVVHTLSYVRRGTTELEYAHTYAELEVTG